MVQILPAIKGKTVAIKADLLTTEGQNEKESMKWNGQNEKVHKNQSIRNFLHLNERNYDI